MGRWSPLFWRRESRGLTKPGFHITAVRQISRRNPGVVTAGWG